jgi:molecular chaperone GrpE (heat shock protein)
MEDEVARLAHAVKYEQWNRVRLHLANLERRYQDEQDAIHARTLAHLADMMSARRGA